MYLLLGFFLFQVFPELECFLLMLTYVFRDFYNFVCPVITVTLTCCPLKGEIFLKSVELYCPRPVNGESA
jgi:hypothetical protein